MQSASGVGEKEEKVVETWKDRVEEVEEYKYLGAWINWQANGFNHVKHLLGKADSLQALVRGKVLAGRRRYYGRIGLAAGSSKAGGGIWQ